MPRQFPALYHIHSTMTNYRVELWPSSDAYITYFEQINVHYSIAHGTSVCTRTRTLVPYTCRGILYANVRCFGHVEGVGEYVRPVRRSMTPGCSQPELIGLGPGGPGHGPGR